MSNTVADRAAAEAHSHPFPTDQTNSLTNLHTVCKLHWDKGLTNALQYTSLGRIRQHRWWTYSPSRALDTQNWTQPPKLPPTQAGH